MTFCLAGAVNADQAREFELNIPRQNVETALNELATQVGAMLLFPYDSVQAVNSNVVIGRYTVAEALELLLQDTRLSGGFTEGGVITISQTKSAEAQEEPEGEDMNVKKKAGFAAFLAGIFSVSAGAQEAPDTDEAEMVLEEIIVTGSHIRGGASVGSPVITIDRTEIDRSGFPTVERLIQSLPQNFSGDASEGLLRTADGQINRSGGTGINLRGLGTTATLTLVNGRRLAQGGGFAGSFVDISGIPLSAVERVEFLMDGASAIYGSDAIAGVVNIILRDDYEGAETRLRAGTVTDGELDEFQFGQTFGKSWNGGNILLTYEYLNRGNLLSDERSYAKSQDLTPLGGDDFRGNTANPGTIVFPTLAAIPAGQDGTALVPSDLLLGVSNLGNHNEGNDLLADRERNSINIMGRQEIGTDFELFGDLRYSRRDYAQSIGPDGIPFQMVTAAHPYYVSPDPDLGFIFINYSFVDEFAPVVNSGEVTDYSGTIGGTYGFGNTWETEFFGSVVEEETTAEAAFVDVVRLDEALGNSDVDPLFDPVVDGYFNIFADGVNTPQNVLDYINTGGFSNVVTAGQKTFSAKADGNLFQGNGGPIKLALGGEYREETLERDSGSISGNIRTSDSTLAADEQRDVVSLFAEIQVPFFGESNRRSGLHDLALSAAVRYEDYSDFGSTTNSKFGVSWGATQSIGFRGSWGTSFKAPKLNDLIPPGQQYLAWNFFDPQLDGGMGGFSQGAVLVGSNPTLNPETSTSWTFGVDIDPAAVPGFSLHLTWYNIDFEDRIATLPGFFGSALIDTDFWAPVTTRDPDDAVVQELLDSPFWFAPFGTPLASDVLLIVDARIRNLAITRTSGLDFTITYDTETPIGDLIFSLNGNYIRELEQAVSIATPTFDTVSTVNNPVDLRLRGSATWIRSGFSSTLFVNYADSYTDDVSTPKRKIDSWTTVDLTLAYDSGNSLSNIGLNNSRFAVTVQNVADTDPPFVNNPAGIGYDPANAVTLGRFVAFNITKSW